VSGFRMPKKAVSDTLDQRSVAPEAYVGTTTRTEIISNAMRPCATRADYAREIEKLWHEAQAKFLAIGRYLVAAKANLDLDGQRGDYERFVRNDLPFGRQIAHQLRVVAEAVDGGRLAEQELPRAYSTAFLLASLPDEQLRLARQQGLVAPSTSRPQVVAFRRALVPTDPVRLQRSRDRLLAEIERREAELEALRSQLAEVNLTLGTIDVTATDITDLDNGMNDSSQA
jgi:hypothetical protein